MKNEENVKISQTIVKNTRKKDYGCYLEYEKVIQKIRCLCLRV